jgi:protein O-mannosyl-transferase
MESKKVQKRVYGWAQFQQTYALPEVAPLVRYNWLARLVPPSILVFLTWLVYYKTLNYPFHSDDLAAITQHFAMQPAPQPATLWQLPAWALSWLNYASFKVGGFEPFYYRTFSVAVHMLAGLAVLYLVSALCRMLRKQPFFYNNAPLISFFTAGLFLLHPVQTQTVSYVIQARSEALAVFALLVALSCYVYAISNKNNFVRAVLALLFVGAAISACAINSLVVVLPALLLLIEWFFASQTQWTIFKKRFWLPVLIAAALGAFAVAALGVDAIKKAMTLSLAVANNRGNIVTTNPFDVITWWQFLMTQFGVVVHYLLNFVWPFGISVEYDWKIAQSFLSAAVIAPLVVLAGLLGVAIRAMWCKQNQIYAFGILWFFVVVAPRSSIIPSAELVCDYTTYLASVGVFFMIAAAVVYGYVAAIARLARLPERAFAIECKAASLAMLLGIIAFGAYNRNSVWQSPLTFWEDNARKAPSKARVHNNFGVALCEAGHYDQAVHEYQTAITLDRYYADPLSNVAVAYSMQKQTDKAISALRSAIKLQPNYAEAYNNLGNLLIKKKQFDDAEKVLVHATTLRQNYGKAYYNLSRIHEARGDYHKSLAYLKRAAADGLDVPEVMFKTGQACLKVANYPDAIASFSKALQAGTNREQIQFNLANAYFLNKDYDQAQTVYELLATLHPTDARYHYNLAETYFIKGDYSHAQQCFNRVTRLPEPIAQAFVRVAHCYERMQQPDAAGDYLQNLLALNPNDEFKQQLQAELSRITLEQKVSTGKGSVTLTDLKQALAANKGSGKTITVRVPRNT